MTTTKEPTKSLNVYQRMLLIMEEVGTIKKSGHNATQNYAFTEHAQVVAEIRTRMVKHGVMILPETLERKIDRYTTMKPGYNNGPAKESVSFHVNIKSRYTIINVDDPSDRFVCDWDAGEALDTSDKATNKATTSSEKYFLMRLFKISDKDDPDIQHHEVTPVSTYNPNEFPREAVKDVRDDDAITDNQLKDIVALLDRKGVVDKTDQGHIMRAFAKSNFNLSSARDMTRAQADDITMTIEAMDNQALLRLTEAP